jgi:DNA recombination protein RmuC
MAIALSLLVGIIIGTSLGILLREWRPRKATELEELKNDLRHTREQIREFERERMTHYGRIEKQIESIAEQELRLIEETGRLKSALTTSQSVRGRWGEMVLRNILRQGDLVDGIDFEEQKEFGGEDGRALRPDFVIRLPRTGQYLVIDSKASLFESYIESEIAADEATRTGLHGEFARKLRSRIQELSSKEYQKHLCDSLPYVILFIPSESAIRAAFDADASLFSWAMERKIFLASPATLLPLILLIGQSWREQRISERAQELFKVVGQLGDRLETLMKRLQRVQSGLDQAVKAWNETVDKSWNGSQGVVRSLDRARELGADLGRGQDLTPIDQTVRSVSGEKPGELALGNPVPPVHDDGH